MDGGSEVDLRRTHQTPAPSATRATRPPNYRLRRASALVLIAALIAGVVLVVSSLTSGASRGRRPQASSNSTTSGSSRGARAPARHPAARATAGPYRVGRLMLDLVEPATSAAATASSASGQPVRVLPTVVRYPTSGAPDGRDHPGAAPLTRQGARVSFPLIVFSQGFALPAEAYSALLDAWARAGYVVADPTYPFTDSSFPRGLQEGDIVNHPADLRFVISTLVSRSRDPASPLHDLLEPSSVAVVGHSDGGDVSLAVASNTCCSDRAVKAAVILSGAELGAFGGTYFKSGHTPMLVVQGSADTVNLPGCSATLYDQAPRPKYYMDLLGAEHEPPYLDPGRLRNHIAEAVVAFLNRYLKHRPSGLAGLRRAANVPGIASLTSAATAPGPSTVC